MINNLPNNSYNSQAAKQKNNLGYVRPPKKPFYMVSTFGGLASIIATFDYLDSYKTKSMKSILEKETKDLKNSSQKNISIFGNMIDEIQDVKKNKPVKYYSLLALGALVVSIIGYGLSEMNIWVKNDENKEKNLKKKMTTNTIIGSIVGGATCGLISNNFLNSVDKIAKKQDYKTKNAFCLGIWGNVLSEI